MGSTSAAIIAGRLGLVRRGWQDGPFLLHGAHGGARPPPARRQLDAVGDRRQHSHHAAGNAADRVAHPLVDGSTFVWSIADQLRDVYKPHRYGGVTLPFTILRSGVACTPSR